MNRAGWNLILATLAVALGIGLSLQPWREFAEQRAKRNQAQLEMQQAERERAELVREAARHDSPIGREELARDRGYRKPNEVPIELGG